MNDARILIISAQASLTAELVGALSSHGYLVTMAGSLAAGRKELSRGRYDLVLFDREITDGDQTAEVEILGQNPAMMGILILPAGTALAEIAEHLRDGWAEALIQPIAEKPLLAGLSHALKRAFNLREKIRSSTLTPLARLSETFLLNLDLDGLLNQIVRTAQNEANCDRVSLMLVDGQEMRIRAAVGLSSKVVEEFRGKIGVGIAGYTAASGEPVIINQGEPDERFIDHLRDDNIKSAISMPLKVKSKVIGVLNLSNFMGRDRFFESDVQFLSLLAAQAAVAIQNANLYNSLQTSYLHTIISLANALEARDASLSGHSNKVLEHSVRIAQKMGLSERETDDIRNAAILHDIGKIGIRDAILLKPGKLDDSEWRILRTHPEVGSHIIAPVRHLSRAVPLILHHHERWDGQGYPSGLAGPEIPLGSRIISVADTYDAMISKRPYRDALGHQSAVKELRRVAGSQLDPHVTAAFLAVLKEDNLDVPDA
ncbi:MAG: GAF domain-containing protein [Myxococcales bacterium]|nr:GAF domain-containing protein [Myxococcales bacterium]